MMKQRWIFGAITLTCMTLAGSVTACPTGSSDFAPPPRPKPVVSVSLQEQANQMFQRASLLESEAATHDRAAVSLDQQADTFANRARVLRNQAVLVGFSERNDLIDAADDLAERSVASRQQASSERMRASEFRTQAAGLRMRASQLLRGFRGGGGWNRGVTL